MSKKNKNEPDIVDAMIASQAAKVPPEVRDCITNQVMEVVRSVSADVATIVEAKLSKSKRGSDANKKKARKHSAFLVKQYDFYISIGMEDKGARTKANIELKDEFGKGYGRTYLNKIIDKHLSTK